MKRKGKRNSPERANVDPRIGEFGTPPWTTDKRTIDEKGPIRFVVTHIGKNGTRTLTDRMQGRYTYETREEAQERVDVFRPSYAESPEIGVPAETLEVRPVECWPGHFDPKTRWFDLEEDESQKDDDGSSA